MPSYNRLLSDNIPVDPSKNTFTGNGSQTVFNLTGQIAVGSTNPSNLIISLDGAIQEPGDDYTVNNSVLTFTSAPDSGVRVVVVSRNSPFTYATNLPGDGTVTSAKIVAGNITPDKLSTGAPVWDTGFKVSLGGHGNPATGLHMNYANYAAILLGPNATSNSFHITKETNSTLNIWTGLVGSGTNRLCMTSSGDIGIGGITSPQSKLDVHGTIGFGLRSGGGNQPGYLSNIWQAGTAGYRFATLGSSYFDGTNWITNHNASFGSNNVSVINVDTSGISLNLNAGTGNTQRTDSSATFNSFERLRINTNGTIDLKNNPVINCTSAAAAWVSFAGLNGFWTTSNAGNNQTLTPYSGTTRVDWTIPANGWWGLYLGMVYYINVGNNFAPLGGVSSVGPRPNGLRGVRIRLVEIIQNSPVSIARCEFLDGTASNSVVRTGTGDTAGFSYVASPIYESYNVSSVTRNDTGDFYINFITPMPNRNYTIVASSSMDDGSYSTVVTTDQTGSGTAVVPNIAYYERRDTNRVRINVRRADLGNPKQQTYHVNVAIFAASGQDNV